MVKVIDRKKIIAPPLCRVKAGYCPPPCRQEEGKAVKPTSKKGQGGPRALVGQPSPKKSPYKPLQQLVR